MKEKHPIWKNLVQSMTQYGEMITHVGSKYRSTP